jgi:hypothetical protein
MIIISNIANQIGEICIPLLRSTKRKYKLSHRFTNPAENIPSRFTVPISKIWLCSIDA